MSELQMRLLLQVIKHHLPMDMRAIVARELPQAYNAWMGGQYARSVHNDGGDW